ncbi:MAG: ABC transporter ATP-binding protein, partial [Muribaculaceae bacterium]|nr:ABC transporter ATP-binding protein [Muribaculaceae bacterium]
GKSTLLNILGLLDNPTEGEYLLDGVEVGNLKESQRTEYRRGRIGFIFQSFNLIEEMNIRDNIMLPLNNLPLSKAEKKQRVDEAMNRMGISHRAIHYPSQLSGGQQQRAAIARAIVSRPGLILADEPTGNLDSKNGIEVMQLLSELHREGATIIMVTHSQRDATGADYIINLFDGSIVENLNDKM